MTILVLAMLCLLCACNCAHSTKQVILSCGDDHDSETERGLPGVPGKRGAVGPAGPKGLQGSQGSKGEPGENDDSWMKAYLQLNKTLTEVHQKLELVQSVKYIWRNPSQVTWTATKQYCEGLGRTLCKRSQIFPLNENVPLIGVQPGDHWTPISDTYRDWVQIGSSRGWTGYTHIEKHSPGLPTWGETVTNHGFKGHVFCCLQ